MAGRLPPTAQHRTLEDDLLCHGVSDAELLYHLAHVSAT